MALCLVTEDGLYRCSQCGHTLAAKKGQLLPPCPRCGAALSKTADAASPGEDACCGS